MKLLQHPLKNSNKRLSVNSLLVISTLISGGALADNSKDAFPPTATNQQNNIVHKNSPSTNTTQTLPLAATHANKNQPAAPLYYIPQQRGYNNLPVYYYYPQQQMMPTYPYYQATPPTAGGQRPSYQYQQRPHYQNNRTTYRATSTAKYPMRKKIKQKKPAWGDERHIWPDFYTDFTGDAWDKMVNAPFDAGRMPGGWRAPSLSTPDPVTVSDAIANQIPPIMEEAGNMTNFVK